MAFVCPAPGSDRDGPKAPVGVCSGTWVVEQLSHSSLKATVGGSKDGAHTPACEDREEKQAGLPGPQSPLKPGVCSLPLPKGLSVGPGPWVGGLSG